MRLHFLSVSPSVGRSGVQSSLWFVLWSKQLFYFFVISGNRQKRKRAVSLTPDLWPQLLVLPLLLDFAPLGGGKSVCSGQGGVVCPGISGRLQDSFPVETGFPPPIFSFSLSHSLARSFARSFSPGPDSNQRLLEERADIYCRRAEQQQHKFEALMKSKTLFLIMFFSFLPLGVFNSKKSKRQMQCGMMGVVVFMNNQQYRWKSLCWKCSRMRDVRSTQILIGCTWLDGSHSSAPGFQTGPTRFGSFSQITKIVFQSVFLKDVLSEKQAPSFSDCRSVFSSVACLASVVSFATPPSQHHRKAICTFFFSAVISFVFLCSATTINGKFNRALPALADTGTNKTVTSRFEPPSLSGRPSTAGLTQCASLVLQQMWGL